MTFAVFSARTAPRRFNRVASSHVLCPLREYSPALPFATTASSLVVRGPPPDSEESSEGCRVHVEPGGNRFESCSNNGSGEPLSRRDPHPTARVAPMTPSETVSDPKNAFDSRELVAPREPLLCSCHLSFPPPRRTTSDRGDSSTGSGEAARPAQSSRGDPKITTGDLARVTAPATTRSLPLRQPAPKS